MVGKYGNGNRFVPCLQLFIDNADGPFIQIFDCFYFEVYVSFVSGFIAGFDVAVDGIICFQCFEGGMRFAFVVG